MPTYHLYVCDRCGTRVEGRFLSPGWSEIDLVHGVPDDYAEQAEPPEQEMYLLCGDCAPSVVARVRESVRAADKPLPTH